MGSSTVRSDAGDPAATRSLAERGRRRAFEEHRAAGQVAKLVDVYRDIVAPQPGRA